MASKRYSETAARVFAIAYTDSAISFARQKSNKSSVVVGNEQVRCLDHGDDFCLCAVVEQKPSVAVDDAQKRIILATATEMQNAHVSAPPSRKSCEIVAGVFIRVRTDSKRLSAR